MDQMSPLERSAAGHQNFLLIIYYVMCYLEAIPLHSQKVTTVVSELTKLSSCVGILWEILMGQGTNFMS